MKLVLFACSLLLVGSGCQPADGGEEASAEAKAAPKIELEVTPPEPMAVPELKEAKGPEDWEAKINNKNREVVELINTLNPVAAYLTEGFKQYEAKLSEQLKEEWADTQAQLTAGTTLYGKCAKRMESGEKTKKLFLDLEEVWQILVKTGVAGLRTKQMMDAEFDQIASK